jgi:periplasmic protein CpxP/Spy
MDTITKNKSLISIIIFLLIMNVAMLVFFLVLNKQDQRNFHGRDQNGISGLLQKEVGFTKEQLDTYQSLRKDHFDKIHILFDELRIAKRDFYNLLYVSPVSDSSVNRAAALITEKQKTLDLQMFNHFKMVRNICTPDQLQKFDTTINRVIIRMTGRPGKEGFKR